MKTKKIYFIVLPILFSAFFGFSQNADEIMRKHYDLKESDDMKSQITMILIDKNNSRKSRKIISYSREGNEGRDSFIEFLEPADVAGSKFLTIAHKKVDDEQRLYLPSIKKTRKIASSGKDGKFMGSDLFFYDLEDRDFEDHSYRFIKNDNYDGKECFVIESTAKDPNAPYSKTLLWVSKEDYFVYKNEAYDKKVGNLWKISVFLDVRNISGVLVAHKMVIDNRKDNHKTLISYDNVKINIGIPNNIFTVQNLEK